MQGIQGSAEYFIDWNEIYLLFIWTVNLERKHCDELWHRGALNKKRVMSTT